MLAAIKIILDIISTCLKLKPFFSACKKNVFFSPKIFICICIIIAIFIYNINWFNDFNNKAPAKYAKKTADIKKIVDSELMKCSNGKAKGNGRAISVSVVEQNDKLYYSHKGTFIVAMAMDTKLSSEPINLLTIRSSFYNETLNIDNNSYQELLNSVDKTSYYPLREGDDQNFSNLKIFPSIYEILDKTEWSKLEKLEQLHIRSTVGHTIFGKKIVYITTLITTTDSEPCNVIPDQMLTSIINVIKE